MWPIDGTQTGITTPGQSKPGSNGKVGVLHNLQNWSLTIRYSLVSYPEQPFLGEV